MSLKKFAESAVKLLKAYNTGAIVDGLIRVDVMCTAHGNWVVNEFEGFEANFTAANRTNNMMQSCFSKSIGFTQ